MSIKDRIREQDERDRMKFGDKVMTKQTDNTTIMAKFLWFEKLVQNKLAYLGEYTAEMDDTGEISNIKIDNSRHRQIVTINSDYLEHTSKDRIESLLKFKIEMNMFRRTE